MYYINKEELVKGRFFSGERFTSVFTNIAEIVGRNKLWNKQTRDMMQCLFGVGQISDDFKNKVSFKTRTNLD